MSADSAKAPSLLQLPLRILLSWLALGTLVSLFLLFLLAKLSVTSVFQVTAESEYIEGQINILNNQDSTHLQWLLHGLTLRARDEHGGNIVIEAPRALLNVGGPARFEAERVSDGSLRLALREIDGAPDVFLVYLERHGLDKKRLYPPVFVTIENTASLAAEGKAISLPLQAMNVIVGREPRTQAQRPQPILRSGEVMVLGRTALQKRLYIARSSQLRGGDVVTATGNDETFKVLVRIDERPALQIVTRVEGERLAVSGFYTNPRFERLTFFNMLANDHILAGIISLLGLVIALMGAVFTGRATLASNTVPKAQVQVKDRPERLSPVGPHKQVPESVGLPEPVSEPPAVATLVEPDTADAGKNHET